MTGAGAPKVGPVTRAALDAALKGFDTAEAAIRDAIRTQDDVLGRIAAERAKFLAGFGVDVRCRCGGCQGLVLVGDPHHDAGPAFAGGDYRLCLECAPTLADSLAGAEAACADDCADEAAVIAQVAGLRRRIEVEGLTAKDVWPPVPASTTAGPRLGEILASTADLEGRN